MLINDNEEKEKFRKSCLPKFWRYHCKKGTKLKTKFLSQATLTQTKNCVQMGNHIICKSRK